MTPSNIQAKVYTKRNDVYYVKLIFPDMYISGITVRPSKHKEELWVQMPQFSKPGGGFGKYIEFPKVSPARDTIEKLCRDAVTRYDERPDDKDVNNPPWENVSI